MNEDGGRSSGDQQQRAPLWSLNGFLHHGQLDYSAPYPASTAHYGQCNYLNSQSPSPPRRYPLRHSLSSNAIPFLNLDTSPPSKQECASPKAMSKHTTPEEHECVVKQNAKLALELKSAKDDAARSNKASRDLAAWIYHERHRLMCQLDTANKSKELAIEEAVQAEGGSLTEAAHKFLELEINSTRAEVGLLPLSHEEMSVRLGLRSLAASQGARSPKATVLDTITTRREMSDDGGSHYSHSGDFGYPSIMEQVEQLIEEEKARLPSV
ncbi:hypothetical protein EJ02DRAFT_449070, partial [Clathrospora elynae]